MLEGQGDFVLYHGKLDISENYNAAEFLVKEVFKGTDIKLKIAGMNPPRHLVKLIAKEPNVELIENPEDDDLQDLVRNAQINILVTAQSTGLKLKLLNALFNGRYCVVNDKMVEGLDINDLCFVANTALEMKTIVADLMAKPFVEEQVEIKSPDMNYISVMNKIFTDYIKENYSDIMDMQFDVPPHILGKENDINFGFVGDQDVVNLINMNDSFKEVYRILINFFRKKRKKTNEFLNENMLKLFNSLVDKINKIISGKSLYEKYTPSFEEYVGLVSEDYSFNYMREGGIENQFAMHQRRKPVNIIVDYFQPINNTHISTSETLNKKNRLKTLFVLIDNKYQSDIRPFTTDKAEFLLKKYLSTNPEHVEGYVVVKKNNIEGILKSICEEYIPVLWAANKSRIEEYSIEMDYAKKHDTKFNVSKRFKLIISPNMENKRILDFIVTGNYQMFTQPC